MLRGTVKFWTSEKGYGFLTRDDGAGDCFVHYTALDGRTSLSIGTKVSFEVVPSNRKVGKSMAQNVKVLQPA
jgi:cold shock protein